MSRELQRNVDTALEKIVEAIDAAHPKGERDRHPDIQCYHDKTLGGHFALSRGAKLTWAVSIRNSGQATISKPPMGAHPQR